MRRLTKTFKRVCIPTIAPRAMPRSKRLSLPKAITNLSIVFPCATEPSDGSVNALVALPTRKGANAVAEAFRSISPSAKQAEEEARRHREQINLLSRVSLLGEMTASLAHELNQPLSAIITNANAGMRSIDRGKEDPGTLREILVDVEADGRRAHDIIQQRAQHN